jgi:hypothetical protein
MPRKEFEAFTRLDASDVNSYLMDQSVMTFAGTAARGSAITEPVEGMVTYLEDLKRYDTYDGSNFVPLAGLTLIKKQTIGSAVSSVVVSDVFSNDFENYRIILAGATASANVGVNIQFGSANSLYFGAAQSLTFANSLSNTATSSGSFYTFASISTNNGGGAASMDIYNPFKEERTGFSGSNVYFRSDSSLGHHRTFSGFQNSDTSFTGFTINAPSATLTGGSIEVYGYRKS